MQSVLRLYNEATSRVRESNHMEAGLNTSTVALQVVGSDEMRTQCPGGITGPPCSWGSL
jgi:hypothetical protein